MNGGLRSTPLLYPAAAFAVGIVLSVASGQWCWWATGTLAAVSLVILLCGRRYAAALLMFAALGCADMSFRLPAKPDLGGFIPTREVTAVVLEARESDSGSRLIADVRCPAPFKAIVYIRSGEALFHRGDVVRFSGVWRSPDAPPDVPHEFSMGPYCFRRGITAICHADRFSILYPGSPKPSLAERMRDRLSAAIRDSGADRRTAGLLEGILLGSAEAIDSDMRERFAEAGLAHLLALSGTHLAVITVFLALVFFPLRLGGKRHWAWLATLAAMWGYVWLTGAPASVTRAAVMASFVIVGRAMSLPTSGLNSLCAAAIAILLFVPTDLFAPGFQMSFLAVAGILMFASSLTIRRISNPFVRALNSWCAVCVAAVIGTAGISAWLFHRFPVAFLLANLPASLLLPLFMGGGILLMLLSLAGISAGWLACCLDWMCRAMDGTAEAVNSLWWHQVEGLWFPWWILIFYYGALLLLYIAVTKHRPTFGYSAAIAGATFLGLCVICSPDPPVRALYRVTDPFCTAWVIFDEGKAWIVSDAPERHRESLRQRVEWRLREPLAIREIDSLRTAPAHISTGYFKKAGNRVAAGLTEILFIDRPADVISPDRRPRYAVVGGHYRHNIKAVLETVSPDTIILSPSLDFRIEQKFARQLDSMKAVYTRSEYRYWK
ncbi:MAG: ComEC family competence protein [Muribaculaceae bacterium]|nr:ComEC family competence protein [Muribaculaceae bacterium]